MLAVRWYLRFGLSYREVEELLTERGIQVDHVSIYRWVQRFMPLLAHAARPCRHVEGAVRFAGLIHGAATILANLRSAPPSAAISSLA